MLLVALVAIVPLLVALRADAGSAAELRFSPPSALPHGDPDREPFRAGPEPSIAYDPSGDGRVYVVAPQGLPSGAKGRTGVAYWASSDGGASFPVSGLTGTGLGGGDADVEVRADRGVLVADLEAIDAAICISTDFARTFPNCRRGITAQRAGPVNDRPWLTRGARGEIYLTYRALIGGLPIIEKSTDGGRTFRPCGLIIDPRGPASKTFNPLVGALVSKPVIGGDGTIYVQFATPNLVSVPGRAPVSHLYMAVARGGCNASSVFTDHVIYSNPRASLGNIFQAQAIDGADQLYVLAAGQTQAGQRGSLVYLFTSTDRGRTWTEPIKVNPPELEANVLPAITGGLGGGEAALGWFGTTTSGDPSTRTNQWRFYVAMTYDGGRSFARATVTPDVAHYGAICTMGVLCDLGPAGTANRNLLDFASLATDPATGCVAAAIPADPYNRPDLPGGRNTETSSAYVSFQQGRATCLTVANAGRSAEDVLRGADACRDRVAPVSRFSRPARRPSRRRGVLLTGRANDRGCDGRRGRVRRVQVALARTSRSRCRFARRDGRFGAPDACRRPRYLRARGTSRWRLDFRHPLRRGRYVAHVRATDAAGNVEAPRRRGNRLAFRVR